MFGLDLLYVFAVTTGEKLPAVTFVGTDLSPTHPCASLSALLASGKSPAPRRPDFAVGLGRHLGSVALGLRRAYLHLLSERAPVSPPSGFHPTGDNGDKRQTFAVLGLSAPFVGLTRTAT